MSNRIKVIAEAGINHNGKIDFAFDLIDVAFSKFALTPPPRHQKSGSHLNLGQQESNIKSIKPGGKQKQILNFFVTSLRRSRISSCP